MICCLGWGSLIWDPRDLSLRQPPLWYTDGPVLPVEFARKSSDGRITLVLLGGGPAVSVLWSQMAVGTLEEARRNLAEREGSDLIGCWPSGSEHFEHADEIGEWASSKDVAGVVWTALPPSFDKAGIVATAPQIVAYLRTLQSPVLNRAMQYVRRAPEQIRTPYRATIEEELGWTYEAP